jgi:hypothetical protein
MSRDHNQHPVAWGLTIEGDHIENFYVKQQNAEEAMEYLNKEYPRWVRKIVPLYTFPPQREWQYLTETEIDEIIAPRPGFSENDDEVAEYVRAIKVASHIEAKLKEKNYES